jgi:hypothetical protein
MCKIHTYKDPDQKPTLYEELEGKGGILKQGVPFFTTEGGPEPTKFKAQHTCLPVSLDEFLPAASSVGAGVKPVKLRLPLAKAISKFTGAINEAKIEKTNIDLIKFPDDNTEKTEDLKVKINKKEKMDTIIAHKNLPYNYKIGQGGVKYIKFCKKGDTLISPKGDDSPWSNISDR